MNEKKKNYRLYLLAIDNRWSHCNNSLMIPAGLSSLLSQTITKQVECNLRVTLDNCLGRIQIDQIQNELPPNPITRTGSQPPVTRSQLHLAAKPVMLETLHYYVQKSHTKIKHFGMHFFLFQTLTDL